MPAATALTAGNDPLPQLAERAVHKALERAGISRANAVLLYLTSDFARHASPSITVAGRAAGSLQVFGGILAGICTEEGWVVDRPAAAAMVLFGDTTLVPDSSGPRLCLVNGAFPSRWEHDRVRFGSHVQTSALPEGAALWQSGRGGLHTAETAIHGARAHIVVSTGLRIIGTFECVSQSSTYELQRIADKTALDALLVALPESWRKRHALPLHLINAVRERDIASGIALISANADGSLTLAAPVFPGERIGWAIRDAEAAAADMQAKHATPLEPPPGFAFFHSCIGRGPYFYGGEDRDLAALCARHPGMPLIGGYGTGQIAPLGNRNRQWQNCVVTALFNENHHVQPQS